MNESPDQTSQHNLGRQRRKHRLEGRKAIRRSQTGAEQPQQYRKTEEQSGTADAMQNRNLARKGSLMVVKSKFLDVS